MPANPNLAVQQRFVTAALSGDSATLAALADPDMVLEQGNATPYRGTYRGAEGFLQFLGAFAGALDIEKLETVRIYQCDDPNYLISEFDIRAVVKATGKPYATTLLERWQFRGGKVIDIKPHYFNSPLHD